MWSSGCGVVQGWGFWVARRAPLCCLLRSPAASLRPPLLRQQACTSFSATCILPREGIAPTRRRGCRLRAAAAGNGRRTRVLALVTARLEGCCTLNAPRSLGVCRAAGCLGSLQAPMPAAAAARVGLAADTDRRRGTSAWLTVDLARLSCQGSVRVPLTEGVYLPGRTVAGQWRGVPGCQAHSTLHAEGCPAARHCAQLLAPLKLGSGRLARSGNKGRKPTRERQ